MVLVSKKDKEKRLSSALKYQGKSTAAAQKAHADDAQTEADAKAARLAAQYEKEGKNADGTKKPMDLAKTIGDLANGAGNFFLGGTAKLTNQGLGIIENAGAHITGNEDLIKNTKKHVDEKLLAQGAGLFGAGGIYNSSDALHNADAKEVARKAGGTALEAATEVLPVGVGLKVGKGVSKLGAKLIDGAAYGASSGVVGSVGQQIADNGKVDLGKTVSDTAAGALLGGAFSGIGHGLSKGKDKLTGTTAKDGSVKELPQGDIAPTPQKRLGESTAHYDQRVAELDAEAQRIRSGDYTGLTQDVKVNPGKKGTTVETQDPKRVQAQQEAAKTVVDAQAEVKRLNDMKLASPYHRQLDAASHEMQTQKDYLTSVAQENGAHADDVQKLADEIDAKFQARKAELDKKYPQDAAEAPVLEQSLQQASANHLDAQASLQQAMMEQQNAVGKIGAADTIQKPDPQVIMGRLQEIEQQKADLLHQKGQAELRISTHGDLEGAAKELADLNTGNFSKDTHPELFNADGTQNTRARVQRVKELRKEAVTAQTRTTLADQVPAGEKASVVADKDPAVKQALDQERSDISVRLAKANREYDPGVTALASSPQRVYEKAGIGPILNKVRDAHDAMVQDNNATLKQVSGWWDSIKHDKVANENIGRFLNGESVSLSPEAQKVANEMKAAFDDYAKKLGLPPERQISNYFPHMFSDKSKSDKMLQAKAVLADPKASSKEKAIAQKQYDKLHASFMKSADPELQRIISKNPSAKVRFGNLEKREFNQDGFSYDAVKVFDAYARRANEKIRMEPALEAMQAARKEVSTKMSDYIAKHMDLIRNNGEARSEFTKALDTSLQKVGFKPGSFEKGSHFMRNLIYNGTMGANVGSAVRNTTQMTNTYALAGEKHFGIGGLQALQAFTDEAMQKELKSAGIFNDSISHALAGSDSGFKKGAAKAGEVGHKALWTMFQTTEKMNRATAYYAGKSKALAGGATEAEARQAGKDMARKAQFNASVVDDPVGFSGPVAKNFLQLASYNVKQVEFMKELVAGSDGMFQKQANGKYQLSPQGALNLGRFIGGSMGSLALYGPILGLTASQLIPFMQEIGSGQVYMSPMVQIIAGKQNQSTGLLNIASGKDKYGNDANRGDIAASFFKDTAPVLAPGGAQAKKFLDNENNNRLGYSATDSGNIRFNVDQNNTAERIKGDILGQYTTEPGRQYIQNLGNKDTGGALSKSASEAIKSATPEQHDQFTTFYQAAHAVTGRDKANKEITKLFKEKNPNQAMRKAAEFNAKVDEALKPYYAKYQHIDPELVDEMNSNLYIKITPQGAKQRARQ